MNFEYFLPPKFGQCHSLRVSTFCVKWKLDYFIFVFYAQFFIGSYGFQVNQEKIHPALAILKVVLAREVLCLVPSKWENLSGGSAKLIDFELDCRQSKNSL